MRLVAVIYLVIIVTSFITISFSKVAIKVIGAKNSIENSVESIRLLRKQVEVEKEKQKTISSKFIQKEKYFLYFLIAIICILFVIIYNRFLIVKRHKQIIGWQVDWAEEQWSNVQEQKDITEIQKLVIQQKQNQIIDSINYAQRIQSSILISESKIREQLPNVFVWYKPREIVSGDFYWFTSLGNEKIIVVADCTGHGVPGAFLSMVGMTLLNEIVHHNKIDEPSQILVKLSENISTTLISKDRKDAFDEGMDISILKLNTETNQLQIASINQSIYIFNNDSELQVIQPNVKSILGIFHLRNDEVINSTQLTIGKKSMIYMTTDGFADQIGADSNKKLYIKGMTNLMKEICHFDVDIQKQIVENHFNNWKKENSQTDDILVFGIKI